MKFKEQFPNIKTLAEPHIVESPFEKGKLAIAYPYTERGEWIHKEELLKYCLDTAKVEEAFKCLFYLLIRDTPKDLENLALLKLFEPHVYSDKSIEEKAELLAKMELGLK